MSPDTNKFQHPVEIVEGPNTLVFKVTYEKGGTLTKELSITGVLSPEEYKASCPAGPSYAELAANIESYKGTRCKYTGVVIGTDINITQYTQGFWKDTVHLIGGGSERSKFLHGGIVCVYGTVFGKYTDGTPCFDVKYVDVVELPY